MTRSARILQAAALVALGAAAQPSFAQGFNMSAPSAPERAATVTAIPGVVAAGAKWELIWRDTKTADGIVGTSDGGVIFAQEQSDTIRKLDSKNRETVFLQDTHGAGSVSVDAQGRVYAVERTCTDPGKHIGLIPTPRVPITLAFSGRDKKTLYVPCMGAYGADGKPWNVAPGVRNTAMTVYRIPMLAAGFKGRPK